MCDTDFFLRLNPDPIRFERIGDAPEDGSSVFYDGGNEQIFVVKGKGADGVVVRGPDADSEVRFCLENRGDIQSIKFSPSCAVLALQRTENVISFVNFTNGRPGTEYSFQCKTRNCHILGFCWTSLSEVVIIHNLGIEFIQINALKQNVKSLRVHAMGISWYVYHHRSCFLIVSMGSSGNVLQALQFASGTMYKLAKFEVDLGRRSDNKRILSERDVCITTLYGHLTLLVLKHEHRNSHGAQFVIYTFKKDCPPKVTHILELELTGRFAVNIVDNLIIVHHQTSQTSLIYDIKSKMCRTEDSIPRFRTLIPPHRIKPFMTSESIKIEMYSSRWAVFQPNVIIDTTAGCVWRLEVDLETISKAIPGTDIVDFLVLRRNSKHMLQDIIRQAFEGKLPGNSHMLGTLTLIFNKVNQALRRSQESAEMDYHITTMDQADMYSGIFSCIDQTKISTGFAAAVLFEYIHSLSLNEVPIQYSTYELLINHLIKCRMVYQLQQFLQYHVFSDSKPLACLLLSLQDYCKNATQLALDMFRRLNIAYEDMIDVYLSVNSHVSVLRALRFVQKEDALDSVSARKFLEVAKNSLNDKTFFVVFRLFELRNLRSRGAIEFAEGEFSDFFSCPELTFLPRYQVNSVKRLSTTGERHSMASIQQTHNQIE
jgi:hypothetical protein